MRQTVGAIAVAILASASPAVAQSPPAADDGWKFFASAYTYVLPDAPNYVQPTLTADRKRLHLEARYNYEAQKTGSLWVGYNFSGGETISGRSRRCSAPCSVRPTAWRPATKARSTGAGSASTARASTVIDTGDTSNSFLYNWSEFTVSPTDALRVGLVVQRTRAYRTDRDVQRGLIVGFSYRRAELTACVFNPDEDKPTFAFSVGSRF